MYTPPGNECPYLDDPGFAWTRPLVTRWGAHDGLVVAADRVSDGEPALFAGVIATPGVTEVAAFFAFSLPAPRVLCAVRAALHPTQAFRPDRLGLYTCVHPPETWAEFEAACTVRRTFYLSALETGVSYAGVDAALDAGARALLRFGEAPPTAQHYAVRVGASHSFKVMELEVHAGLLAPAASSATATATLTPTAASTTIEDITCGGGVAFATLYGSNVGLSGYSLEVLHNVDVRSQVEEVDGAYETQERKDPNWKGERDCCEACVNWRPPAYVVATQCNGYVLNANGDCYLRSGTSVLRHDGGGVRVAYRVGLGPDPPPPPVPPHAVAGVPRNAALETIARNALAPITEGSFLSYCYGVHNAHVPLDECDLTELPTTTVYPSLEGDHLRARAWARGGGDLAWLDQGVEGIGEFARYSEATHACEQLSYRGCQGVVHRRYADGTERYVPALSAGGPTFSTWMAIQDTRARQWRETATGRLCRCPCPFGSP